MSRFIAAAAVCVVGLVSPVHAQDAAARRAAARDEYLRGQFDRYDRNDDGVLTRGEVRNPRIFQRLDVNGDGRVTRGEGSRALGLAPAQPAAKRTAAPEKTPAPKAAPEPPKDEPPPPELETVNPAPVDSGEKQPAIADATPAPEDDADAPAPATISVRAIRNIAYRTIPGVDPNLTSLDIYAPSGETSRPVVLFLHGGAWSAGDKAGAAIVGRKPPFFVSNGYLFVSANYRLSPAVVHPAHVEDVAAALAWTSDNIARYGGDPARIFVMGHSAGAHLGALVCLDDRRLTSAGKSLDIVKGAILLDGAGYDIPRQIEVGPAFDTIYTRAFTSDTETQADASPLLHAGAARGKAVPPFLIFHVARREDSREQSESLAAVLREQGIAAEVVAVEDKTHATINRDLGRADDAVTSRIVDFLAAQGSPPK